METVKLTVNGKPVAADVEPSTLLVELLREHLKLTGTHVGCDTTHCGACVVHLDGQSVKSCSVLAVQAQGARVTTIEGVATGAQLHPLQRQFQELHGLQCGFCTPGMVMSSLELIRRTPNPTEAQVREWLSGNFCRCTGYQNIVQAVIAAAKEQAS